MPERSSTITYERRTASAKDEIRAISKVSRNVTSHRYDEKLRGEGRGRRHTFHSSTMAKITSQAEGVGLGLAAVLKRKGRIAELLGGSHPEHKSSREF